MSGSRYWEAESFWIRKLMEADGETVTTRYNGATPVTFAPTLAFTWSVRRRRFANSALDSRNLAALS